MNSRTWALADGSFRAEVHAGPINYRGADGTLNPIDTTFKPSARPGFAFENVTNSLRTFVPSRSDGWLRVESESGAIEFRALDAKPQLLADAGCRAVSAQAFADGAIRYEVGLGKLKETITLARPGMPAIGWAVRSTGLTPSLRGGSVLFLDAAGNCSLTLTAPWMTDARGRLNTDIQVTLVPNGLGWTYTITPSAKWLATATYPVVIDPTVTGAPATDGSVTVTDNVAMSSTQFSGGVDPYGYPPFQSAGSTMVVGRGIPCTSYNDTSWSTALSVFCFGIPADCDVYSIDFAMSGAQGYYCDGGTADCDNDFLIEDEYGDVVLAQKEIESSLGPIGLPKALAAFAGGARCLNVTLNATDTTFSYGYVLGFEPSAAYVTVTYNASDWCTFQGNARRTGRSYTTVGGNPALVWRQPITLPTSSLPVDPQVVKLYPSVLAVSQSLTSTSALPYVFTTVAASDGSTVITRTQDTAGGPVAAGSRTITGFVATGTPVIVGNKLVVIGNTSNGKWRVYALHADNLSATPYWEREQDGSAFGSLAYSPIATQYTNEDSSAEYCTTGCVLVACNASGDFSYPTAIESDPVRVESTAGILCALSIDNGHNVWGHVSSSGALVADTPYYTSSLSGTSPGGLVPFWGTATNSGPSISLDRGTAYVGDDYYAVDARDLTDGSIKWNGLQGLGCNAVVKDTWAPAPWHYNKIEGSPSLFENSLFYTFAPAERYTGAIGSGQMRSTQEFDDYPELQWSAFYMDPCISPEPGGPEPAIGDPGCILPESWITPPIFAEGRTTFFADDSGAIAGVGTDRDPNSDPSQPISKWVSKYNAEGSKVRCSPLVAGSTNAGTYVYFGADSGYIYVFMAAVQAGTQYVGRLEDSANGTEHRLRGGPIRASMACYNGHLYALTTGKTNDQSLLDNKPTLYKFGQ